MSELANKANDLANQAVEELVPTDYKPFGRQVVQTLGDIPRMINGYNGLGVLRKPVANPTLGAIPKPKPLTGWGKFKAGLSKVWSVIKAPAQKLISSLPFGGLINKGADAASGLINYFKGKK
ncbi:Hypothetical_protein [Hexamita inflata]|uniref:Hypothetical_protein n=1 Tax=Hexamita inflata TaxID=28002 RepID=A0AA86QD22_9EUKA|nr:Hypothetical protein HINF_LOCUS41652 [Hexamita inflata]